MLPSAERQVKNTFDEHWFETHFKERLGLNTLDIPNVQTTSDWASNCYTFHGDGPTVVASASVYGAEKDL